MKAGELRHRVVIETPTIGENTNGETLTNWASLGLYKAAIEPLAQDERFLAEQQHASATHRIRLRYRMVLAAMTGKERVVFGTRIFPLVGLPITVDERGREIHLLCEEGLRQE